MAQDRTDEAASDRHPTQRHKVSAVAFLLAVLFFFSSNEKKKKVENIEGRESLKTESTQTASRGLLLQKANR